MQLLDFTSFQALVAQWIEQEPSNLLVAGSIPAEGALRKGWFKLSHRNLTSLAQEVLAAYQRKDIEYFSKNFSEDVVLRDWNLQVTGRDAAIKEFSKNFRDANSLEIKILQLLQSDDSVAAQIEILVNQTELLRVVDVITFTEDQSIRSIIAYKGL